MHISVVKPEHSSFLLSNNNYIHYSVSLGLFADRNYLEACRFECSSRSFNDLSVSAVGYTFKTKFNIYCSVQVYVVFANFMPNYA